jgi:KDO2-lipid IV(A) lauroyltransferase
MERGMHRLFFGWLTSIAASLPLWLGYGLARLLAGLHYALFPARRHAALANLAVVLPATSRRERARVVRQMMYHYNAFLYEFFRLPHLDRDELMRAIQVEGRDHLEAAVARRRGVIIVSSHLGNWELAGVLVASWGYPLHAVAGVQFTRWLSPAVRETKSEMAVSTVSPEDGFKKLYRALEHNELVALLADGDIYHQPVTVELFGRETPFPAGPSVLSMRTGALIVPGFCQRLKGGRFRVVIEPPLDPAVFESAHALSQAVAARVETHIREHVEQWCIFRPVWTGELSPQEAVEGAARRVTA